MKQKNALGKGLASLLSQNIVSAVPPQPEETAAPETPPTIIASAENAPKERMLGITLLNIETIMVNQYQPRREFKDHSLQELAQNITEHGIIQPLVVRKHGTGKYELIAGERRLRASKLAGLKQVPVVVRKSTDKEALELAILENIQRENLNCVDEALAYAQLMQDFYLTLDEVAQKMAKDKSSISNSLRILKLPPQILDLLRKERLTLGHAKAILSLEEPEKRLYVSNQIIHKKLSVRQTEALVQSLLTKNPKSKPLTPSANQKNLAELANKVTSQLSAKVELKGSEKKGKIVIYYTSKSELERLLDNIRKEAL